MERALGRLGGGSGSGRLGGGRSRDLGGLGGFRGLGFGGRLGGGFLGLDLLLGLALGEGFLLVLQVLLLARDELVASLFLGGTRGNFLRREQRRGGVSAEVSRYAR